MAEITQPIAQPFRQPMKPLDLLHLDDSDSLSNDRTISQARPDSTQTIAQSVPASTSKSDHGLLDFDLAALGHEDERTVALKPPAAASKALDFGDFDLGGAPPLPVDSAALARKLELAEEFRQIGDVEGARDLLEEVVAKSQGPLKTKAQGMLDQLARR